MTDFKIGDVVRLKTDGPDKLSLTLRCFDLTDGTVLCMSECSRRITWVKTWELELVNRPDPQADIKQAIREVLLSDEFMKAFAAAFMKTPLPMGEFAFCEPQEPGELCEPKINNSILPELKSARLDLSERTLKAIWQANDGGNQ